MFRMPLLLVAGLLIWFLALSSQPLPSKVDRASNFHAASNLLRDAPIEETLRRFPDYSVSDLSGRDGLAYRVYRGLQILGLDVDEKNFKKQYKDFQDMHGISDSFGVINVETVKVLDREVRKREFEDSVKLVELKKEFPGLKFLPGTSYTRFSNSSGEPVDHHKTVIYDALKMLPKEHAKALRDLTLYYADEGHRGLGGGNRIILKASGVSDDELKSVFIHEMGHIVDTGLRDGVAASGDSGFMDGKRVVPADDPSVEFYKISWLNNRVKARGTRDEDFVSGYAKSDPFEDFAESYVMYVMQAKEFRYLAQHNDALKRKYEYIRDKIFDGVEFESGVVPADYNRSRYWDITVRPVKFELAV